ncbi:hypothetical protein V7S43_004949 [Phytophthora oleae]|uniref:Uncharacterized protein n=1 Tax=Phytophthora oleae TaxID=2107226 RepID=A0ABD3FU96_9STRA
MMRLGNWKKEIDEQLRRIWWAWCSIGTALLWQIRDQVMHEGVKWTAKGQLEFMWRRGLQQLYAVAQSEAVSSNLLGKPRRGRGGSATKTLSSESSKMAPAEAVGIATATNIIPG